MAITICGTGCSLVDYLYTGVSFTDPNFLRYQSRSEGDGGLVPGKLVFAAELEAFARKGFPQILGDIVGKHRPDVTNLGGPSIVALIHAAQLTYSEEVAVKFYGVRGDDESGATIHSIVSRTPVDCSGYQAVPGVTPFTNVFSDPTYDSGNGERTFVNALGVAAQFGPGDLDPSFFDADIAVFGGTGLVPTIHDALTPLLQRAKRAGALTVVNTVYDFRAEKRSPTAPWPLGTTDESLPLIDLLVVDREEALRISGRASTEEALEAFIAGGAHSCVITQGSDDILIQSDGTVFGPVPPTRLPVSRTVSRRIQDHPEDVGDTTGCGDNFVGGLLASTARQMDSGGSPDLTESCSWAVASGGFTCFYVGGTFLEDRPGQKLEMLLPYYQAYCEQIQ